MTGRHALTFRGEDYTIPPGYGRCTACSALVTVEQWLETECPGRPVIAEPGEGKGET